MSLIEIVAALFGFWSVWFYIHRHPYSWPTGLIQVVLLWGVFWQAKLYADLGLHVLYAALQIYGWHAWRASQRQRHGLPVGERAVERTSVVPTIVVRSMSPLGHVWGWLAISIGTTCISGLLMRYTDAELPVFDSFIAAASIFAQMLLAWRYIENWVYWILVDVVCIGVFAYKELYPTTVLYVLFLVMAIFGFYSWRRTHRNQAPDL